jgi:peroxiredoxin
MNKLLLLLLLPVISFAQVAKEFTLKGQLKTFKPIDKVYFTYASGDDRMIDSAQTANGEFSFSGKITEPTVGVLTVKYMKQPEEQRAKREVLQIFLEPSKMSLVAKDSLVINSVTGSDGHVDFASMMKQQEAFDNQYQELYKSYSAAQAAGDKAAADKVEGEIDQLDQVVNDKVYLSFLKSHPNSNAALYALKTYAGYDIDPAKVEPLFNSLPANQKSWPSAVAFKDRIEIAKKTAIGKYAMDFTQNDTSGNAVSLSSFKGKYVLVDFWASWCGPCRRENPNVVKVFNKFRDKNFTILSVSLDQPNAKDKWLAAIHKDGLTWTHVSDLKYWDNEVAKEYGIRAIPQNLLLDPQGKIIAKNLRGEELDSKLSELIK